MTETVEKVGAALRGERRIDADRLLARMEALRAFLRAVGGHVSEERLVSAHTLVERAGARLALSREHTVVALAGATGSGKSSLFNALARFDMSPVGVRRPTTGATHACVWGPLEAANRLLDWLGVLPRHRFVRESALDGDDEVPLHGLILLDLPDFDSVERTHRLEVDRLLGLVDLVVWVVDPQKYADRVVHDSYLREFRRHRDVTVVALNQADRLPPAEVPRVVADLRRLLDADDLAGVPVLATSALNEAGTADLRARLEQTVTERQAVLRRLSGDLEAVTGRLAELVAAPISQADVDPAGVRRLTGALAAAAGVPAVAEATEQAYRHRAGATTGWPLVRGWRRLRPDPLRRLHLPGPSEPGPSEPGASEVGRHGRRDGDAHGPVAVTSVPDPTTAQRSAVGLAVRAVAEQAGAGLPTPWPAALTTAARSRLGDLPDALDRAVASTDLGLGRTPVWWRLVNGVQWLAVVAALVGLAWLLAGTAITLLGFPAPHYPTAGLVPVPTLLLAGGLLFGPLLAIAVRPLIGWTARWVRSRAERRLHAAVAEVGKDYVIAPIQTVLRHFLQAREALETAGSTD